MKDAEMNTAGWPGLERTREAPEACFPLLPCGPATATRHSFCNNVSALLLPLHLKNRLNLDGYAVRQRCETERAAGVIAVGLSAEDLM